MPPPPPPSAALPLLPLPSLLRSLPRKLCFCCGCCLACGAFVAGGVLGGASGGRKKRGRGGARAVSRRAHTKRRRRPKRARARHVGAAPPSPSDQEKTHLLSMLLRIPPDAGPSPPSRPPVAKDARAPPEADNRRGWSWWLWCCCWCWCCCWWRSLRRARRAAAAPGCWGRSMVAARIDGAAPEPPAAAVRLGARWFGCLAWLGEASIWRVVLEAVRSRFLRARARWTREKRRG